MRRTIPLLLALALAAGCGSDGPVEGALEAVGLSENVDEQAPPPPTTLDDVLDDLDADGFNGIVLVEDAGQVRTAPFGTSDGPDGPPIDEDTVFDIGSVTKQFTGAAIVRLEMDGLLSVEDPLGDHLAEVEGPLAQVTLHELLTHTAGLPDAVGLDGEEIDRAGFIERAMSSIGDPGEYRYSNVGYSLLGMVIETVSSGSYEAYLRDVFLDPLAMDSTGYVLPDFDERVVAVGYDGDTRLGAPNELPWADDGPWWNLRANGGLLSSAADMRRWSAALDGDAVLSDEAKEKLFGRHVEEGDGAGTYYGYGWVSFPQVDGGWFLGHNGGNGIFFADILRFPDEDVVVFVATNTSGVDEDLAFRIAEVVVDGGAGARCLPPADLARFQAQADFPSTPAAGAASALIDVLLDGDDASRSAFIDRHVSETLAQGLSVDEQAEALAGLALEFVGYTVDMVHVEDAHRLYVTLESADAEPLIVTVAVDESAPDLVECVGIDGP